ncbi:hypothetical protein SAMN05446589_1245 [Streptomyces sp. OV198]|uniref:hypothetical protein n=1 Tax=Streptomyces sp. OV198 TaxID=1882787 RepID=UPI000BD32A6B|nr:hypothetical protein [Streptomyces sp. OV198]SOE57665.1 hypothetical protein SAMN05446589_1245 [Streptomyces sp. OV198]
MLDGLLRDGEPVMKVAAVIAWAPFDPQEPVRRIDLLVETLSDLAVRPRFEEIWYMSDVEEPFTREAVVTRAAELFDHDSRTAASFVVRLADAAARTGDTELSEAVLDEAWRLLVLRPYAAPALLPVAGRLLEWLFGEALRALARIGTLTPATRAALRTVRGFDGRLAQERNYEAFLQDEELRAAIEYLLVLP